MKLMLRSIAYAMILGLLSCSSSKDVTKFKRDHVVLSLEKGGCPGTCSVYNVRIYKNRYAVYEGLVNVEKFGLHSRRLPKEEFEALTGAYDRAGFMGFQDSFDIESADMPVISMMYRKKDRIKTVTGSTDRPGNVLELQQLLEKAGKSGNWIEVRAYEPKYTYSQKVTTMVQGENIVENQLIIEPAEGVDMQKWITKYTAKGASIHHQLSANLNYWLITIDTEKMSAFEFMKMFKADSEVRHVEFNRKISPREH